MYGFFHGPAEIGIERSYLTCLKGFNLCILMAHISPQYILINIYISVSRSLQSFAFVCMRVSLSKAVCIMTHIQYLGSPGRESPLTMVREREGQRILQYPTEHWVVIDLFSAVSLSRQPLCA